MTTMGSAGAPESGAEFRRKFEDLQAENEQLRQVTVGLAQRSFPHLQPGDFDGIDPNKYVEHAESIQSTRESDRERIFTEVAAARGFDISTLTQGQANQPPAESAANRIASIGELRGTPPAPRDNTQGLEGRQLLEAEYARQEAAKR